jgi:endogenous inhibitor of DNA gyrase (YacG/DUF329 family)
MPATTVSCPTCDQTVDLDQTDAMPFCSERCRLIDLGRWLDEQHSVPVERIPDEFEDPSIDTVE